MNNKFLSKKNSIGFIVACSLLLTACTTATVTTTPTASPSSATSSTTTPALNTATQSYTLAEVSAHNTKSDCWLLIDKNVYNVTNFISSHPGGDAILQGCGKDATALFSSQRKHQGSEAQTELPKLKIGELKE